MKAEARLQEFAREFGEGNWTRLSEFVADRFFSHTPGPDEPTAGERFTAIVDDLRRAMPDLRASVTNLERDGDMFTASLTVSGTHANGLWGAPGSGRWVEWSKPVTIVPVDEAFAVRFDQVAFPDIAAVFREFGLINPPDAMDEPPVNPVSIPDFLLKVVFTGQAADKPCSHLEQIAVTEPTTRMCAACFEEGTNWPALRMCLICGAVGCCDMSKNKHARGHYETTGHALIRSIRMDEGWIWCYEDNALFEKRTLDRYRN